MEENKNTNCEVRRLKIYAKYVRCNNHSSIKAELRITSNYLSKYGFKCGTIIDVYCMPNELRIIVVDENKR